jgi:hypothetical protein
MGSIVLAIALVGLLSAIFHIYRLNEAARENDLALQGATEMMERLMAEDVATAFASFNGTGFNVSGLSEISGDADGMVGLVTIDNTNPDLLSATVRVEWRGRSGNRAIELATRLIDRQ